MAIRSHNDDPSQDTVKTDALSERHLAPPKISQQLAETHGMFDDPTSGTVSYSYEVLAERDRGKFRSSADSQDPIEPDAQSRTMPSVGTGSVISTLTPVTRTIRSCDWPSRATSRTPWIRM